MAVVAGLVVLLTAGAGGLWGAGLLNGAPPAEASSKVGAGTDAARKLPEIAYIQLDPLAAPVIGGGRVRYNVMLTLSLEIGGGPEDKANVARLVPRLRDAMLRDLYARPVVRDEESGRIDLESVKDRMFTVARNVVGERVVRDLLVVSAVRVG